MKTPVSEPLLTVKQVAEILRLCPETVKRMIRSKRLLAVRRNGGRGRGAPYGIARSELAAHLERSKVS